MTPVGADHAGPSHLDAASAYWSQPAAELLRMVDSRVGGLSADEAAERLRRFAGNSIRDTAGLSAARLFLRQVQSPLVLMLVFGAAVSLFVR